jgi:hypothetical protein
MTDEDLLKCPILTGLDAMHRAELLGWLNSSSNLRAKMEECLTEKQVKQGTSPEPANPESRPRDFNKAVHSWNPQQSVFSRSPKE